MASLSFHHTSLVLFLLVFSQHCSAAVYNVGDSSAWSLPGINYNTWASSKRFRVDDILRFTYASELHNVMLVSQADYESCSSNRPLATYFNGQSLVRLPKPGTYYFICGVPGHCQDGMKMQVTVG